MNLNHSKNCILQRKLNFSKIIPIKTNQAFFNFIYLPDKSQKTLLKLK